MQAQAQAQARVRFRCSGCLLLERLGRPGGFPWVSFFGAGGDNKSLPQNFPESQNRRLVAAFVVDGGGGKGLVTLGL